MAMVLNGVVKGDGRKRERVREVTFSKVTDQVRAHWPTVAM